MPTLRRIARGARVMLVAAAIAGYAVVSHLVSTSPAPAGFGTVLFAIAPLFVALLAVTWRSHRWPALALAAAAVVLLWREADLIAAHLPYVYLLQSVCTNAALMLLFGASLRAGTEPLCTRLAAAVRSEPLTPEVVRYTRQVTITWTIFFAAMIMLSSALFVLAPVTTWSLFANLLYMPMIGAMFVVEYLVRRRVLRGQPQVSLATTVRAWQMHAAQPEGSSRPMGPIAAMRPGPMAPAAPLGPASREESKA